MDETSQSAADTISIKSIANLAALDDSGTVPDLRALSIEPEVLRGGPSDASRDFDRGSATYRSNYRGYLRTDNGLL